MTEDIAALIAQTKADYPQRTQASNQLSALGTRVLPDIIEEIRNGQHTYQTLWINILLDMESPDLVPALVPLVNDRENIHVVATACRILAHCGDSRALAPLCEAVIQGWVPFSSFKALGELGNPDAIPVLREVAAKLLGDPGDLDALAAIAARACDEDYVHDLQVLIMVATALAKLGDQVMAPIAVALCCFGRSKEEHASEDYVVRMEAVASLRYIVGSGMVSALSASLRDPEPDVLENAIDTTLYLGIPDFISEWTQLLRTADEELAVKAYQAMHGLTGQWPVASFEHGVPSPERVTSWWQETRAHIDSRICTRFGQPASPALLFPLLGDYNTLQPARAELHAITGIDFAPAIMPFWGLDLDPVGRAQSWWQDNSTRFESGSLYRFGRRYELATIY